MGPVLGPGDAGFVSPEDYQAIVDEYNLAGHPVDEFSGAVVDRTVDLALFGLIPVELTRVYNSHFSSVRTQLGVGGWAFGLAQWIEEDATGPKLRDADGRFVRFDRLEPGERGFRRARRYDIARTTSGTYTVYSIDTRLEREFAFSRPHADAATERALLRTIRDRYATATTPYTEW